MASNFVISLLLSLGIGAWLFSRMTRTPRDKKRVLIVVGVLSLVIFIALLVILSIVFKKK